MSYPPPGPPPTIISMVLPAKYPCAEAVEGGATMAAIAARPRAHLHSMDTLPKQVPARPGHAAPADNRRRAAAHARTPRGCSADAADAPVGLGIDWGAVPRAATGDRADLGPSQAEIGKLMI